MFWADLVCKRTKRVQYLCKETKLPKICTKTSFARSWQQNEKGMAVKPCRES